MRKILVLLLLMMMCGEAFALELPDSVGEWRTASTHIVPLVTEYNNESHGRVVYRTYSRESPSGIVDVILTEGTGTGTLYVPEKVRDIPGVMPSDSGYEVVKVSGHDAILEAVRNMPLALVVNVSVDAVLTVETGALDGEGVVVFAEEIIRGFTIRQ